MEILLRHVPREKKGMVDRCQLHMKLIQMAQFFVVPHKMLLIVLIARLAVFCLCT
jgi:hypothetical protein